MGYLEKEASSMHKELEARFLKIEEAVDEGVPAERRRF
jgi:hypothetical protein